MESAVHSLVHPCCASVKSASNPRELRRFITGANCVGVERRSRVPWHRDNSGMTGSYSATAQLTSATDGNSSWFLTTTVVQVGYRLQVLGILI